MSLPRISDRPHTTAPTPTKSIDKVVTRRDTPQYIEKTIRRLEVLDDVATLETPAEIKDALTRWAHVLHDVQADRLRDWLSAQVVPHGTVTDTEPAPSLPAEPAPEPEINPFVAYFIGLVITDWE